MIARIRDGLGSVIARSWDESLSLTHKTESPILLPIGWSQDSRQTKIGERNEQVDRGSCSHGLPVCLRINAADGNLEVPGPFPLKTGTCFYAPSDGNYVYWVRPLIYTWADFFTNTLHALVPKGSFFYEKNAYGVWRVTDDLAQRLDELLVKLKNPLRVY